MSEETLPPTIVERCPRCGADLPAQAEECPYCGVRLLRPASPAAEGIAVGPLSISAAWLERMWGYEYRSPATLFGLPLLHIAYGYDLRTGCPRIARGIIAIGNTAVGVLALGGLALGGIAIGGVSAGVFALAGVALGVISLGGMAVALWLALGGLAVSAQYAIGGLALAPHALGANVQDPALLRWIERILGPHLGE